MQHTASHCNTLQHTATHCNTLQHTATHRNTPQHTATHTATHRNILQHTATHCITLHIATHCPPAPINHHKICKGWRLGEASPRGCSPLEVPLQKWYKCGTNHFHLKPFPSETISIMYHTYTIFEGASPRGQPLEMPLQKWCKCGTNHFHLTSVVRWK